MMEPLIAYMRECTVEALLGEVSTTPKPGLVDRLDSGAHRDMDYHTFALSTEAITPWLLAMAEAGFTWRGDAEGLFYHIRPLGIQAEQAMFEATGGVNTHKGIIFSMGILEAACAWYYRLHRRMDAPEICALCREMTYEPLEQDFEAIVPRADNTHGERLYLDFGCRGIRGEAQSGFASVLRHGLPAYRAAGPRDGGAGAGIGIIYHNRRNLQVLLHLMAEVEDTNVYARAGSEGPRISAYVKDQARRILALGGAATQEGMDALTVLNQDFIQKNISPGGCADLLALTLFLGAVTGWRGGNP